MRPPLALLATMSILAFGLVEAAETTSAQAAFPRCDTYYAHYLGDKDGVRRWQRVPSMRPDTEEYNCMLQRGDDAPGAIRALQGGINCSGGGPVDEDGKFGPMTEKGLRKVQHDHREQDVDENGVYGPPTRNVMSFGVYNDAGKIIDCEGV